MIADGGGIGTVLDVRIAGTVCRAVGVAAETGLVGELHRIAPGRSRHDIVTDPATVDRKARDCTMRALNSTGRRAGQQRSRSDRQDHNRDEGSSECVRTEATFHDIPPGTAGT